MTQTLEGRPCVRNASRFRPPGVICANTNRKEVFLALVALALAAALAASPATRCGWLENPTPGNWWLNDRDGEWTISIQGGYEAGGAELPDMSTRGWVVTNGMSYGYGCACLRGAFDLKRKRLSRLVSARSLPLKQCRADRALPKP